MGEGGGSDVKFYTRMGTPMCTDGENGRNSYYKGGYNGQFPLPAGGVVMAKLVTVTSSTTSPWLSTSDRNDNGGTLRWIKLVLAPS